MGVTAKARICPQGAETPLVASMRAAAGQGIIGLWQYYRLREVLGPRLE
jgi:hypothetical protein